MTHAELLRTLTLGTARRAVSTAVHEYLELRDAVDPTADDAEKLLAAWAIQDRLHRFTVPTCPAPAGRATPEVKPAPNAKLSRALGLLFEDTYAAVLPEAITVLNRRGLRFPPVLLPPLLTFALGQLKERPLLAEAAVQSTGQRGAWLAAQHPEWKVLTTDYPHEAAFGAAVGPAERRQVLDRWRTRQPTAARAALADIWPNLKPTAQESLARALANQLSDEDVPWLKKQLGPKRKGVRRVLLELLLLAGDEATIDEMTTLAAAALTDRGGFVNVLKSAEPKEILNSYGGLKKKETLSTFLLYHLPPPLVPGLLGQPLKEFWPRLTKGEMKAAAAAVRRYQIAYPFAARALIGYALVANQEILPLAEIAEVVAAMPTEDFEATLHSFMDAERHGFRTGGTPMLLPLARTAPWSERVSKAYVLALVDGVRDIGNLPYSAARRQAEFWHQATPLVHPAIFPFLQQHLHGMTERPDQFGRLALNLLQMTSFRTLLYKS